MPITGTFDAIKAQIKNALSLDMAATPDSFAAGITSAIASAVPAGVYPPANPSGAPPPLVPAGAPATQTQVKNAVSLDKAATPDSVSKALSAGIVSLVPMVPPVAQMALEAQIKNALSLDMAATPDSVASIITAAVISYYTAAGVV